ncbi:Methyltransferase domain-containing protein 2 [Elsinoe fawcettii]|nr:Methyltransferase domain-containing protein 2 [Elsinoe fawcettii]
MTSTNIQDYISRDTWKSHSYTVSGPQSIQTSPSSASPMRVAYTQLSLIDSLLPFSSATSVLDIACGPGTVYAALFDSGITLSPSAKLLATDISPPMVGHITARQAEKRAGDDETWGRVQAWVADATDLDTVKEGSQSHVISQMGIFLIPDAEKALAEVKRVMRKDAPSLFSMSSVAEAAWNTDVLGVIEERSPERKLPVMAPRWKDAGLMKGFLEEQGFREVRVEEVRMAMGFEDEEKVVEGLWGKLPYIKSITEGMTEEEIRETKKVMVERIKERFPGKELPGKALVALARV